MEGRENIREWIVSTMNTFPGSEMPVYPVEWYSIDTDKGWVIFKNVNTMKDPGDGSVHGAPVITVLEYAGDDKWSYEEDAYNPMNFLVMVRAYIQRCHELGIGAFRVNSQEAKTRHATPKAAVVRNGDQVSCCCSFSGAAPPETNATTAPPNSAVFGTIQ